MENDLKVTRSDKKVWEDLPSGPEGWHRDSNTQQKGVMLRLQLGQLGHFEPPNEIQRPGQVTEPQFSLRFKQVLDSI